MRSLVLGASGLIGRHVLAALAAQGAAQGTALSRAGNGLALLDVRDAAAVDTIVASTRPDVLVLAAAEPFVDLCEREPERTWEVNVTGTAHVCAAADRVGARVIFFSSDYVFDGRRGGYQEDDAVGPLNEYGRQKVAAEELVRATRRSLIVRTSDVFGHDERRKNFACQIVDRLRAGATVRAASDQVLCPTAAAPLASAVCELIAGDAEGTYHVVGPEPLSRARFARRVASAFGLDEAAIVEATTAELGGATPRPKDSSLRDARLRARLGHGLPPLDDTLAVLRAEGL